MTPQRKAMIELLKTPQRKARENARLDERHRAQKPMHIDFMCDWIYQRYCEALKLVYERKEFRERMAFDAHESWNRPYVKSEYDKWKILVYTDTIVINAIQARMQMRIHGLSHNKPWGEWSDKLRLSVYALNTFKTSIKQPDGDMPSQRRH